MNTIGITCDKKVSGELLESALLLAPSHYELKPIVYPTSLQLVEDFNSDQIQGLIFGLHEFTDRHLDILSTIKKKTPFVPMSLVCAKISESARARIATYHNTTVLMYPSELSSLPGVFNKMFSRQKVNPRQHVRHSVRVAADMKFKKRDYTCVLRNLSEAGACCEIYGHQVAKKDDVIVHIPLPSLLRSHKVKARVVWTRDFSPKSIHSMNYQQVGFQFLEY